MGPLLHRKVLIAHRIRLLSASFVMLAAVTSDTVVQICFCGQAKYSTRASSVQNNVKTNISIVQPDFNYTVPISSYSNSSSTNSSSSILNPNIQATNHQQQIRSTEQDLIDDSSPLSLQGASFESLVGKSKFSGTRFKNHQSSVPKHDGLTKWSIHYDEDSTTRINTLLRAPFETTTISYNFLNNLTYFDDDKVAVKGTATNANQLLWDLIQTNNKDYERSPSKLSGNSISPSNNFKQTSYPLRLRDHSSTQGDTNARNDPSSIVIKNSAPTRIATESSQGASVSPYSVTDPLKLINSRIDSYNNQAPRYSNIISTSSSPKSGQQQKRKRRKRPMSTHHHADTDLNFDQYYKKQSLSKYAHDPNNLDTDYTHVYAPEATNKNKYRSSYHSKNDGQPIIESYRGDNHDDTSDYDTDTTQDDAFPASQLHELKKKFYQSSDYDQVGGTKYQKTSSIRPYISSAVADNYRYKPYEPMYNKGDGYPSIDSIYSGKVQHHSDSSYVPYSRYNSPSIMQSYHDQSLKSDRIHEDYTPPRLGSSSNGDYALSTRARDYMQMLPAKHATIHIHKSVASKKKSYDKYIWPLVGGAVVLLLGFLILSNILLSLPLLALGAQSLFGGGNNQQQLIPVYNISQPARPPSGRKKKRRRRKREASPADMFTFGADVDIKKILKQIQRAIRVVTKGAYHHQQEQKHKSTLYANGIMADISNKGRRLMDQAMVPNRPVDTLYYGMANNNPSSFPEASSPRAGSNVNTGSKLGFCM